MICKFQAFLDQDEGDGQADDERFDVQEEDSVDVEEDTFFESGPPIGWR